ncbi:hypothetical protein V1520DRAFT_340606 [Lipomyces starkeyi]|uniref:Uncharacterized protein n=1 Tax=Lipomyces starkeyi NRRL Y-11557 TaxID=675824 RepID=A0A1E3Q603_LIPST|nr:hypothetical protein LIPSTDRAFT_27976 [Lipomyces starkeyi NRRL Y-11557]
MGFAVSEEPASDTAAHSNSPRHLCPAHSHQSRHLTTSSNGTSPTITESEREQLQSTRRASADSRSEINAEQTNRRKSSAPPSVSISKVVGSKRSSIRAFFGKHSVSAPSPSGSGPNLLSKLPSTESPALSVTSSNGSATSQASNTQLPQIDFSTADASHIHSYYKKFPYSMAMLHAVAVDSLACNTHGSLFAIVSKSYLDIKTFVLLPHAILRYALNTSSTAVPEQVLLLSAESVAYASDDIPGQQFVLRVSERPERHQLEEQASVHDAPDDVILETKKAPTTPPTTSARRSIFFHTNNSTPTLRLAHHHDWTTHSNHYHQHHHHISLLRDEKTRTMLLVFDTAAEFMRWMDLTRSQIKLQRESLMNKRYDPFESETLGLGKTDNLGSLLPPFDGSHSISRSLSTTQISATVMTSSSLPPSKRPSVISTSSSIESQPSQRLSPLSGARQNSSSSVQTLGSLASSKSSSSLSSLQESLNSFSIRPQRPPAARRESTTFSSLARLTSLRRAPSYQRQRPQADSLSKPVDESAILDEDDGDGISFTASSVGTNVRRKNRMKVIRRLPAGPPPSRPLPPIPAEQI